MHSDMALVAGAAYGREDCLGELKHAGWRVFTEHAGCKCVVLLKGNTFAVGFRGTVLTDPEDLADDAALVTGVEDSRPRFQRAVAYVRALLRAYPRCRVILAGHSLGGSLCLSTCYKVPGVFEAHAFNPFASPVMIERSNRSPVVPIANYTSAVAHCVLQDPITESTLLMGQISKEVRLAVWWLDPHDLDNFLTTGTVVKV